MHFMQLWHSQLYKKKKTICFFGIQKEDWQVKDWKNVIFLDKCWFCLPNESKMLRVWWTTGEDDNPQFFPPKFSNSISVMFCGSIGPKRVGKLAFCDGQVNAEKYFQILQDNLFGGIKSML